MDIEEIIEEKWIKDFEVIDTFNNKNCLKGIIYHDNDHYGDLRITHINGKPYEQYIYTTPKFNYPPENEFLLMEDLIVYDKLDGTNICMYNYKDAEGNLYWTYKTRLNPVVKNSRFGPFLQWTKEMLARYSDFISLLQKNVLYAYSFELYGSLNKVLIDYTVPLDFKLLFMIDKEGNLYPPTDYPDMGPKCIKSEKRTVKILELFNTLKNDLEITYEDQQVEGVMIYGIPVRQEMQKKRWEVYKCKPSQVFDLMGSDKAIQVEEIETTMKNALELCNTDDDIIPVTCELLEETYSKEAVENSRERIEKTKEKVLRDIVLRDQVMEIMRSCPFEIKLENKGSVMRWIIQQNVFTKEQSTKIYATIFRNK